MVPRGKRVAESLGLEGMWGAIRLKEVRVRLQGTVTELKWAKEARICSPLPPIPLLPPPQDPF